MKKSTLLLSALLGASLAVTPVFSQGTGPVGFEKKPDHHATHGPVGFDKSQPVTIKQLKNTARDEDYIIVRGRFTEHVRGDKYLFTDESGDTIVAELDDDKDWSHVKRNAPCEIWAEVDKNWKTIELEVKRAVPIR